MHNKLQLHPYGIIIVDNKKRSLGDSKMVEICEKTNDEDSVNNNTYNIVIDMSDDKNKALNTKKNFHMLDARTDPKQLIMKDKKVI
jgi:hypothetical protein